MESDMTITLLLFAVFFATLFYIYYRAQQRIKEEEQLQNIERSLMEYNLIYSRQDNDVWNISGRMNSHSQNLDSWPTHDHHVSIDSFAFPPDYQAKDPRLAPPPYTEVDLPTYEEAVACANNKNAQQPAPVHTITITRQDNAPQ